jgi:hypothetical protein
MQKRKKPPPQLSDNEICKQLRHIAKKYTKGECFKCAKAIRHFLEINNIQGQVIKLSTGDPYGNGFIYHDHLEDVISENGIHVGVKVVIGNEETIFDNFDYGVPFVSWLENLVFPDKIHFGREFEIEMIEF